MSPHDDKTLDPPPNLDADLGPVILQCRPLPSVEWVANQGLGLVGAYVLMPAFLIPFFAAWPAGGCLLYLADKTPLWLARAAGGLSFGLAYSLLFWLVYFQPRNDHLILCQHGFKVKFFLDNRTVLFRDLKAVTFGSEDAILDGFVTFLSVIKRHQANMLQELASAAMNLRFKDGDADSFKNILNRFEPEDLQEFLIYLAEHHPELFREESHD